MPLDCRSMRLTEGSDKCVDACDKSNLGMFKTFNTVVNGERAILDL